MRAEMPGIAQVFLTDKEIQALLKAAPLDTTQPELWGGIKQKLTEALGPIACPVPTAREEKS